MPFKFTNAEYADMVFVYGVCNGNTVLAKDEYRRRFPNRKIPNRKTFQTVFQHLRETGSFQKASERSVQRQKHAERVLDLFDLDPRDSLRRVATVTGF